MNELTTSVVSTELNDSCFLSALSHHRPTALAEQTKLSAEAADHIHIIPDICWKVCVCALSVMCPENRAHSKHE